MSDTKSQAHKIIHAAAAAAAAAAGALAQGATFGADTPVQTGIHVGMVIKLGQLFGQSMDKSTAMALLGTAAGAGIGVAAAKGVLGWLPLLGNIANAAISLAYTEALGWFVYDYFSKEEREAA